MRLKPDIDDTLYNVDIGTLICFYNRYWIVIDIDQDPNDGLFIFIIWDTISGAIDAIVEIHLEYKLSEFPEDVYIVAKTNK